MVNFHFLSKPTCTLKPCKKTDLPKDKEATYKNVNVALKEEISSNSNAIANSNSKLSLITIT